MRPAKEIAAEAMRTPSVDWYKLIRAVRIEALEAARKTIVDVHLLTDANHADWKIIAAQALRTIIAQQDENLDKLIQQIKEGAG